MKFGWRVLSFTPCSLVVACGGTGTSGTTPTSEPVEIPTTTSTASTDPPGSGKDALSVVSLPPSEHFVFDGAVGEWILTAVDTGTDPEQPEEPREQEPIPAEPVGRIALVVGGEGLLIAGELARGSNEAVWVGVGTRPATLPYIGTLGRAAGSFDPVVCSEKERIFTDGMYVETETPTPPETLAACKAVVARYDAYVAERNARFSKVFRIDGKGVTDVTTGRHAPIAAAKVLWKTAADGSKTFEATLPNEAMPRVADAPLFSMRVLARSKEITVPASRWTSILLGLPLMYEPHSQLRSELILLLGTYSLPYQPSPGISFHPSKPNLLEVYDYGTEMISPSEAQIFVEHASVGDVKIGKVDVARSFLATYKGNEFVELYEPIHGWGATTTSQPVERSGSHHLFHFSERLYGGGMMFEPPGWAVTEIGKDGHFKELLSASAEMPPPPESGSMWWSFDKPEVISNKTFTEFGYRGVARENAGEQDATIKWRWDAKKKTYEVTDWKMGARRPSK